MIGFNDKIEESVMLNELQLKEEACCICQFDISPDVPVHLFQTLGLPLLCDELSMIQGVFYVLSLCSSRHVAQTGTPSAATSWLGDICTGFRWVMAFSQPFPLIGKCACYEMCRYVSWMQPCGSVATLLTVANVKGMELPNSNSDH